MTEEVIIFPSLYAACGLESSQQSQGMPVLSLTQLPGTTQLALAAVFSLLPVYPLPVRRSFNEYRQNTYYEPTSLKAPTVNRDQTPLRLCIYLPEKIGEHFTRIFHAIGRASSFPAWGF